MTRERLAEILRTGGLALLRPDRSTVKQEVPKAREGVRQLGYPDVGPVLRWQAEQEDRLSDLRQRIETLPGEGEIELPRLGVYRHYKGDLYEVTGHATMSNTDMEGNRAVIYRSVNRGTLWVRSLTGVDGWATPLPDGRGRFEPFTPVEPPFPYMAVAYGRRCRIGGLDADRPYLRSAHYDDGGHAWVEARFVIPLPLPGEEGWDERR